MVKADPLGDSRCSSSLFRFVTKQVAKATKYLQSRMARTWFVWIWIICSVAPAAGEDFPWKPDMKCKLNPAHPQGLHPDAYAALRILNLTHRITQGINHSPDRGNVHNTDVTVKGIAYTAAADISVRCLTEAQIQSLLADLAGLGFAGWYRKNGQDGWTGPPHIHAVWAGCRLKPFLQYQIESWLDGGNGLGANERYRFWEPSKDMKDKLRALYRRFN